MGKHVKGRFTLKCQCGTSIEVPHNRYKRFLNRIYRCKGCTAKWVWENKTQKQRDKILKPFHAAKDKWFKDNPLEASAIGINARKYHKDRSAARKKQQDTIESSPETYKKYCDKRREIAIQYHASLTDTEKEILYAKIFKNTGGKSKAENCFFDELAVNGLVFSRNECIKGFFPDGVCDNIIIEFYGDMYHCNPNMFKDRSQYCSWISRTVAEQWDRDRQRLAVFYKYNYKVIIVWESDWNTNKEHELERIKNALRE